MGKLKQCKIIGGIQVGIYLLLIILTIMAMCNVFEKKCSSQKCKDANEDLKKAGDIKYHRKWTLRYSKLVIYFLKLGFAIFLIIAAKKRSCDYLLVYCVLSIEGFIIAVGTICYDLSKMFDYVGTSQQDRAQALIAQGLYAQAATNTGVTGVTIIDELRHDKNKADDARLIIQDLFDIIIMLAGAMRTYKARKEIKAEEARVGMTNNQHEMSNRSSF